ncbi:hypothetical protein EYC87_16720 [Halieaceae bacterium IMCC8485]|uniref:Class II aldolase/adducin N-terminal domain-containing protein n=1 Tax=Candidatus Seongchinamella marina TaxID=2518990 RepID=A0ABT3T073_9GAMM|nr:class II aldolase/adducin family protein [Candidatus Seongchinamella marina]MCX2975226.1 hypothetical protein [Candidatus Seongchinamella marina]
MPLKQYRDDQQSRQALVDTLVELGNRNLNKGTSGNVSASTSKEIPAMHYMVAAAGGYGIPLAGYATFGRKALSAANLEALSDSMACLLANHGQLTVGVDLESAIKLAELVEEQAHCYWGTLLIGGPVLLEKEEMDEVLAAFVSYGQQEKRVDLVPGKKID